MSLNMSDYIKETRHSARVASKLLKARLIIAQARMRNEPNELNHIRLVRVMADSEIADARLDALEDQ